MTYSNYSIETHLIDWALPTVIVQCNHHYRETISWYYYETKEYITESVVAVFRIKYKEE